jgi:predicted lipoprotein with Yx(FWY)xxD motif
MKEWFEMRTLKQSVLALATVGLAAIVVACGSAASGAGGNDGAYGMATATPSAHTVAPSPVATQKPAETQKPAATTRPTGTTVGLGRTGLGSVLVDAKGLTLYLWAHDKSTKSTCNGDCAEYWPPLLTDGMPAAARGVNADLLGTSRRSDGKTQVTYAGHPLYYFVQDAKPGDTKGEGLTGFGGRWDPVSASGAAVMAADMSARLSDAAAEATLASAQGAKPLDVQVISPRPGATAGAGGTFTVDLSIQARSHTANSLLDGYAPGFIDPNSPAFHPGPDGFAPGLVVLLSTTPTIDGTPLQGPNTNLAGVFQINDISLLHGRKSTFNSWIVGVPGFFGQGVQATLTVFVVQGTAPAVVDGSETPISDVVQETFTIAK